MFGVVASIHLAQGMVYNAIGQSAQPILSYNFGARNGVRVRKAFRLALLTAVAAGLGFFGLPLLLGVEGIWLAVPLKHIASYLWITPQSLNRIRAKLGKKKG